MSTGRNQHIVPQMMIRRFAGDDDKLVELYKPTLSLGTRRKSPKGILHSDDFYRDELSDFDNDVLTPIEQRFARIYPALTDPTPPKPLVGKEGAFLIDWIAGMLVRTRAHSFLAHALAVEQGGICTAAWSAVPALMNNLARSLWLSECQDHLTRPKMRWKFKIYRDDENVVLSDHPVCQTSGMQAGGQVTIVPLSKHRVLFGGSQEAVDRFNIPVNILNAFLAG